MVSGLAARSSSCRLISRTRIFALTKNYCAVVVSEFVRNSRARDTAVETPNMAAKKRKKTAKKRVGIINRPKKKTPTGNLGTTAMAPPFMVAAHYYCGMMLEAVDSVVHAHHSEREAKRRGDEDSLSEYELLRIAGPHARYGFLTACFAAEAGANALLESLPDISQSLVSDLEQLKTINKFEVSAWFWVDRSIAEMIYMSVCARRFACGTTSFTQSKPKLSLWQVPQIRSYKCANARFTGAPIPLRWISLNRSTR
jgi:hypothetical protein